VQSSKIVAGLGLLGCPGESWARAVLIKWGVGQGAVMERVLVRKLQLKGNWLVRKLAVQEWPLCGVVETME